jgi:hypothetical protein
MFRLRTHSIIKRFQPFLILLVLTTNYLYSQNQSNYLDSQVNTKDSTSNVYGMDPSLYNGMLFNSFNPGKVKGDQYFLSSNYLKGEATIRGIKYKNLDLNYDIYKQQVLLRYFNSSNVFNIIMLSKAWLENFSIGNDRFVIYNTPENPNRIYQVLGNDSIQLLIYWEKVIAYENDYVGNTGLRFDIKKEFNVLINKSLKRYNNNRSFVHQFAKEQQPFISKYLRKNKIKVNNAPDQIMEELINYCSKISIK